MTKDELFNKYSINKSHNVWDNQIDNWFSIEIYRVMNNGDLLKQDDKNLKWVIEFLDKVNNDTDWSLEHFIKRSDFGSLYLTAKRMVYRLHEEILEQINKNK